MYIHTHINIHIYSHIYQHPLEILVSRGFVWPSKSLAHRVVPDAYASMRQHASLHMYIYKYVYMFIYIYIYVCSTHTRVPREKKNRKFASWWVPLENHSHWYSERMGRGSSKSSSKARSKASSKASTCPLGSPRPCTQKGWAEARSPYTRLEIAAGRLS